MFMLNDFINETEYVHRDMKVTKQIYEQPEGLKNKCLI